MTLSTMGDRIAHATSTVGQTSPLVLGSALGAVTINAASFQSFASAGITNGQTVSYLILDANGNWEVGTGVYTSAGTTLTRVVLFSSNSNTAITLSGSAQVFVGALNEDIGPGVILHVDQDQTSFLTPAKRGIGANNLQLSTFLGGRLTLATGTPVMTSSQTGKTTAFFTPYLTNKTQIYDGTNMEPWTFSELSIGTSDTTQNPSAIGASKVNDWFLWNRSGTLVLSHGPDWTNDTTRSAGTALVMVNGIQLNNAQIGDGVSTGPAAQRGTYVGTTRSNASSQIDYIFGAAASGGTAAFFGVWNMYNRVTVATEVVDNGAPYTYTTATAREARGSTTNQISFVMGLAEDGISATYSVACLTTASAVANVNWGIGLDSTTTFRSVGSLFQNSAAVATSFRGANVTTIPPQIGVHIISANELGDGAAANTFDQTQNNNLSAILRM
jgi:hypothetical protein